MERTINKKYQEIEDGSFSIDSKDVTCDSIEIDSKKQRYPFCIVWTTLPLISHLFPIIGHTGICS